MLFSVSSKVSILATLSDLDSEVDMATGALSSVEQREVMGAGN
jgi:hypothetical protein